MEPGERIRALIVEDEPDTAGSIEAVLRRRFSASVDKALDCSSARDKIASQSYDIVTLDYQLPDGDGLDLLGEIKEMEAPPPVIMVTGHGDEHTAVKSFQRGANGYVVKDKRIATLLTDAVEHALSEVRLRRAEDALSFEREQLLSLFESVEQVIYVVDPESHEILYANRFLKDAFGKELVGGTCYAELQNRSEPCDFCTNDIIFRNKGVPYTWEYHNPVLDRDYLITDRVIQWHDGRDVRFELAIDVTSLKSAERRLRESEAKYRSMFDSSIVGVVSADLKGRILDANNAFQNITGYTLKELKGTRYEDLTPEKWLSLESDIHEEQVLKRGFSDEYEKEYLTRDGSTVPVSIIVWLIRDGAGNPTGLWAMVRDLSERKRAEEELSRSSERLKKAGEAAYDLIYEWDVETGRLEWFGDIDGVLGYEQGRISHDIDSWLDLIHPDDAWQLANAVELHKKSTEQINYEYRVKHSDGSWRYWKDHGLPLLGDEGVPYRWIGVCTDITERKDAEAALQRSNVELEGFAHTVSHDLKGPISAICALADVLLEEPEKMDSGDLLELAAALKRNAENAHDRIEALLELAESGQQPRELVDVDIDGIIRDILDEQADLVSRRGVEVRVEGDMGTLRGDPEQVRLVFSNLLSNAIRHNHRDCPLVEIRSLEVTGEGARAFLVRDNGPGIPENILENVLFPFVKGPGGDTGLGLSIVRRVLEVYGGDIEVYNSDGACFEFVMKDYPGPQPRD